MHTSYSHAGTTQFVFGEIRLAVNAPHRISSATISVPRGWRSHDNQALDGRTRRSIQAANRKPFQSEFGKLIRAGTEVFLEPSHWITAPAGLTHLVPAGTPQAGVLDGEPVQQEIRAARTCQLLVHRSARVMVVRSAQHHDGGHRLTAMAGDPDRNATHSALC